jgi:hypothetical protein
MHFLDQACAELQSAGIEVVLLKGAAYLGTLYPAYDRPMVDVDVLVRESDREAARSVLRSLGYESFDPPSTWRYSFADHYNWAFTAEGRPVIEVHTRFCARGMFDIDYGTVFDRAVPRQTADGRSVRTLSAEDALLHMAVHLVKDAYVHGERLLNDARLLVESWSPDFDVAFARSRQWRVSHGLGYLVEGLERTGVEVPAIPAELRPGGIRRRGFEIYSALGAGGDRGRLAKLAALAFERGGLGRVTRLATRYSRRRAIDLSWAVLERFGR